MLLVDSHCHLNFPDFAEDIDAVIDRARDDGVRVMQSICTKLHEFETIHAIAQRYDDVYCSIGIHPHEVEKSPIVPTQTIVSYAQHPEVIGIGETGLDYYYEHSPRALQQESFRNHIAASRATGLPVIVHSREADEDTVAILKEEYAKGAFPGLIHCFSSTAYLAEEAIKLGMLISISGIITFKKSEGLRAIVKTLPAESLLVETDSPYLAPTPMRGQRNEPAFTRHVNRVVAELKDLSEEECARITTDNFFRLFTRARDPRSD